MVKIIIVKGTTPSFDVTVVDKVTNAAFDLTGYTMYFTVKKNSLDVDGDAIIGPITATVDTPTSGVGRVALTASDTDVPTGEYYYDVRISTSGGGSQYVVVGPSKDLRIVQNIKDIVV